MNRILQAVVFVVCAQLAGCGDGLTPDRGKMDQPPSVDAGSQQFVQSSQIVILSAVVIDDGISGIKWTQKAGTLVGLE
jgi:hypothetical protein